MDNVEEYKNDMVDHFYNQWITNFTLGVDTFLVLSATLTAFTWFKKIHKNLSGPLPSISISMNFNDIKILRPAVKNEDSERKFFLR